MRFFPTQTFYQHPNPSRSTNLQQILTKGFSIRFISLQLPFYSGLKYMLCKSFFYNSFKRFICFRICVSTIFLDGNVNPCWVKGISLKSKKIKNIILSPYPYLRRLQVIGSLDVPDVGPLVVPRMPDLLLQDTVAGHQWKGQPGK